MAVVQKKVRTRLSVWLRGLTLTYLPKVREECVVRVEKNTRFKNSISMQLTMRSMAR